MRWLSLAALLLCALTLTAQDAMTTQDVNKNPNKKEPPMLGPHWSHDAAHGKGAGGNPDMSYHGGPILPSVTVEAIWWGSSWPSYAGDEITGMDSWYKAVGETSYAATVNEYTDSAGQSVTSSIAYQGHVVDGSSLPKRLSTSAILAEVCKVVPKPVANGYYPVYVDKPRGNAGYCAYHSWGSCGGTPVEFGFFFKMDGDAGCDPDSTVAGQTEGLQADANVSGHELSETRSDPNGNAWYDNSGEENGDKCAWTFGGSYVLFGSQKWQIQGNWSNYDYDHNSGYANSSGQKGCADGTNYPGPYTH
jgi:hypothetical protein